MENSQRKFKFDGLENLENSSLSPNFKVICGTRSQSPSAHTTSTDFSDDQQDFNDPSFMLYFSSSKLPSSQYQDPFSDPQLSPMSDKLARCKRIRKSKSKRWTADEDRLLVDLYFQHALDWKTIAKLIPGRAPDAVKNRFYGVIKKNASFSDQNRFNMAARKARENKTASYQIFLQESSEQAVSSDSFSLCKSENNALLELGITELKRDLESDTSLLSQEAKIDYLNTLKRQAEKLEEMLREVKGMIPVPN